MPLEGVAALCWRLWGLAAPAVALGQIAWVVILAVVIGATAGALLEICLAQRWKDQVS